MITANFDVSKFNREMKNLVAYSSGYIDGIALGKKRFLASLGESAIAILKEYVDSSARLNPEMLHHIYEWGQTGSPDARLFNINYTVSNIGLSFNSSFSQSRSIQDGATEPFYDKARIMEEGIPVTIRPKKADVLVFNTEDGDVFTPNPVTVKNPGGEYVRGSFEKVFDDFFNKDFSQAFFRASGIGEYLNTQTLYKKNLQRGIRSGRSAGINTGFKWIANAAIGAN